MPRKILGRWKLAVSILLIDVVVPVCAAQTLTTLVEFNEFDGLSPYATFVQGRDGNVYGTTSNGGPEDSYRFGQSNGFVFGLTPQRTILPVYNFCGNRNCVGGSGPQTSLVLATDGNFYGTTEYGGNPICGCGTIFRLTPQGDLTYLYFFDSGFNTTPSSLVEASDGNFYGTTSGGGDRIGDGTIFRISSSGVFQTIHEFDGTDGSDPYGGLIQGADGDLYGTTVQGGTGCSGGCGTVFKISLSGQFTSLHSFNGTDGIYPSGSLVQATDGYFYGMSGGHPGGNVFKMSSEGEVTVVCELETAQGSGPVGGLVLGTDGNFYGMTQFGGPANDGNIVMITPDGNITQLYAFSGSDGLYPFNGLFQATDGLFYGMTNQGGTFGFGTAFSLSTGLSPFVAFVQSFGRIGHTEGILGQGFTGTTGVDFNGVAANFTVVSDTFLTATVPAGATTGYVTVETPTGSLKSNVPFQVIR